MVTAVTENPPLLATLRSPVLWDVFDSQTLLEPREERTKDRKWLNSILSHLPVATFVRCTRREADTSQFCAMVQVQGLDNSRPWANGLRPKTKVTRRDRL